MTIYFTSVFRYILLQSLDIFYFIIPITIDHINHMVLVPQKLRKQKSMDQSLFSPIIFFCRMEVHHFMLEPVSHSVTMFKVLNKGKLLYY